MKKYYHMLVEEKVLPRLYPSDNWPTKRKVYISTRQGSAPAGWKCVCVLGYHEQPKEK